MRIVRSTMVATAMGVMMLASASPALADVASVQVEPEHVKKGQLVSLFVTCESPFAIAWVQSKGFAHGKKVEVSIPPDANEPIWTGEAVATHKPGKYKVFAKCSDGSKSWTWLHVKGHKHDGGGHKDRHPHGGASTGGGSTAAGMSTPTLAGGLALVAVGAGVGLLGLRRRRGEVR